VCISLATAQKCGFTIQHFLLRHCNTLQHTATHCNTPQHNTTQHIAPQHTTRHHKTPQHTTTHHNTPQHTTTHHNTPHHTTTHCNTVCTYQSGNGQKFRFKDRTPSTDSCSHRPHRYSCCSVLQSVAVCCSVKLGVENRTPVDINHTDWCSCCSVLQCVAVCCSAKLWCQNRTPSTTSCSHQPH